MHNIAMLSLIATLVLSFNGAADAKRAKEKTVAPKKESPVRMIDADYHESLGSPDEGARFVLKNVPLTMNDTRYVEGTLASNMTIHVSASDFQSAALFDQIKANCSTIGIHDKAEKDEIENRSVCKFNLYGEFSSVFDKPFYIPETLLTKERRGYFHTYYFNKVRLATASEIDPPTTAVTAEELKMSGPKFIGQWVSMRGVVRSAVGGQLQISIGGDNVVQIDPAKIKGDRAVVEHLGKRCYADIEFKDIYEPTECTYTVKFRVVEIKKRDAKELDIFDSGKKGDVLISDFSFVSN